MKNISIHSLIGLTVLCMSSCTDDYTDWATPQANEQEAAITLPDFSASKVDDINLSNPGSSIKLFTLSNATLPEGYTLGNVRVELSTEKGKAGELESNTDGMIDSLTIQKLVVETYGKRPIARPFIAQVYANAIKDGQALLVNAGSFDVNFTPAAPFIDTGYYLVGDMFTIKNDKDETSVNGWSADGMVGFSHSGTDVYEDSKFSIVFTTTADNQCWKIIPKTNTEGEFWGAGVLGTVTDGDTATEGTLTTNNPQAGMITQAGMYRMTLDMMEYTYTLEELGFAPYIYEIGNNTSWSGTCPLAGINFDGKYRGFAYLNGEFKYKPNPEKDNWTGDWEKVSGDALAGTFAPQSIKSATPFSVGIRDASGGLSTPLILPTITCPPTRIAPELPADTNASAFPSFTIFIPTTMEESFFLLIAFTGGSAVSITSVVFTTSSLFLS